MKRKFKTPYEAARQQRVGESFYKKTALAKERVKQLAAEGKKPVHITKEDQFNMQKQIAASDLQAIHTAIAFYGAGQELSWGYVGSMGYILSKLQDIKEHLNIK